MKPILLIVLILLLIGLFLVLRSIFVDGVLSLIICSGITILVGFFGLRKAIDNMV